MRYFYRIFFLNDLFSVKHHSWNKHELSVCSTWMKFANLFYYSIYFLYYSWVLLHFLVLFMDPTILFHITFTFIYSTFSKKFSISVKQVNLKQILNLIFITRSKTNAFFLIIIIIIINAFGVMYCSFLFL